jgi:hypothetical protein
MGGNTFILPGRGQNPPWRVLARSAQECPLSWTCSVAWSTSTSHLLCGNGTPTQAGETLGHICSGSACRQLGASMVSNGCARRRSRGHTRPPGSFATLNVSGNTSPSPQRDLAARDGLTLRLARQCFKACFTHTHTQAGACSPVRGCGLYHLYPTASNLPLSPFPCESLQFRDIQALSLSGRQRPGSGTAPSGSLASVSGVEPARHAGDTRPSSDALGGLPEDLRALGAALGSPASAAGDYDVEEDDDWEAALSALSARSQSTMMSGERAGEREGAAGADAAARGMRRARLKKGTKVRVRGVGCG